MNKLILNFKFPLLTRSEASINCAIGKVMEFAKLMPNQIANNNKSIATEINTIEKVLNFLIIK